MEALILLCEKRKGEETEKKEKEGEEKEEKREERKRGYIYKITRDEKGRRIAKARLFSGK